ncbi:hypothetical protein [Rhizobium sp. BK602]|uniref:hypothetical protein n=1 Tax=Rhizobium sp. BK602 TaxID=2586986 RepID=UPI00161085A3|nr:hypothetical protein [Rhizobium sp. BK602]MBB3610561.1 hypothetical protein [Rhizobium sp. BK602]
MKSPWKFLAELTSRRRPAETQESSIADDVAVEASESDARRVSPPSSNATEVSGHRHGAETPAVELAATTTADESNGTSYVSQADLPSVADEKAPTPAGDETARSGADAQPPAPESRTAKRSKRVSPARPPERAKRTRTDKASGNIAAANADQNRPSPSPQDSFFDEVARLEGEIGQLRSQLAQKLRLQNLQLIKMLERFEAK